MKFSGPLNLRNWAFYDVAHSAFAVGIVTFIFPVYFSNSVIGDPIQGASLWALYIGLSGILVAILSPLLGMFIDKRGNAIGWIRVLTSALILATASLWFIKPASDMTGLWVAAFVIIVANTVYELAGSVSNTLLPSVTTKARIGRASNIAWGAGYIGGVIALLFMMLLFIGVGGWKGLLQVTYIEGRHIRACFLFVAAWVFMFSLPLLLTYSVPQIPNTDKSLSTLWQSLKGVWENKNLRLFMIGSAIYRDGLATLFAVGALYAGGVYKLDAAQIMVFGIWLNVMAGLGGLLLARYDDKIGSRRLILFCLFGLICVAIGILFITKAKIFLYLALLLGVFVGPAQAAGRTMLTRLVPRHELGRMFGIYALTGRSISFMGPFIFSGIVALTGHLQAGMASIIVLWLVGGIFIYFVQEKHA